MGHLCGDKILFTGLVIAQPFNRYHITKLKIAFPLFQEPEGAHMHMYRVSVSFHHIKADARLHIFGKFFDGNIGYLSSDSAWPTGDTFRDGALVRT